MPSIKPQILVLDDDANIIIALETALEDRYEVAKALTASEGLKSIAKKPPTVVLLDILLPDFDGKEVLKKIKSDWPLTEVIMITAVTGTEEALYCMERGAYDYLAKPLDVPALRRCVAHAVEKADLFRGIHLLQQKINVLERSTHKPHSGKITKESFAKQIGQLADFITNSGDAEIPGLKEVVRDLEYDLIIRALNQTNWNQNRAAARLKIYRNTLLKKMRIYNIPSKKRIPIK